MIPKIFLGLVMLTLFNPFVLDLASVEKSIGESSAFESGVKLLPDFKRVFLARYALVPSMEHNR